MHPRSFAFATTSLAFALACSGAGTAPTVAPVAPPAAPEATEPPVDVTAGPPIDFLQRTTTPTGCKVEFVRFREGKWSVLHTVAEVPFGCADIVAEASPSGQQIVFVHANPDRTPGKPPPAALLVSAGTGTPIALPGGAIIESFFFDGENPVAFSVPEVSVETVEDEERGTVFRVERDGQTYEAESPIGSVEACLQHRGPNWEGGSFQLLGTAEGMGPPFCRNYALEEAVSNASRALLPGKKSGFGEFFERIDDPELDASGNLVIAARSGSPGVEWIWGSPYEDLEGQHLIGPLTVFVNTAAGWTRAEVPLTTGALSVSPPLVCSEGKGRMLYMSMKDATTHAQTMWSSEHCALLWPDGVAAPPAWKGLAEAPAPAAPPPAPPPPASAQENAPGAAAPPSPP